MAVVLEIVSLLEKTSITKEALEVGLDEFSYLYRWAESPC